MPNLSIRDLSFEVLFKVDTLFILRKLCCFELAHHQKVFSVANG